MNDDLDQITIGGRKVGIIGLKNALAQLKMLNLKEPVDIRSKLLELIKESNYVPSGFEKSYEDALYEEYRRFSGEKVEDEFSGLEILILGPGCRRCDELKARVMTVAAEFELAADIRHVEDLEEIGKYGPVTTPALVINGRVRMMGKVPSFEELKDILAQLGVKKDRS